MPIDIAARAAAGSFQWRQATIGLLQALVLLLGCLLLQAVVQLYSARHVTEYRLRFDTMPERTELPFSLERPARYPDLIRLDCAFAAGNESGAMARQVKCLAVETADADGSGPFWLQELFPEQAGWKLPPSGMKMAAWRDFGELRVMALSLIPTFLLALFLAWRYDWRGELAALARLPATAIAQVAVPFLAGTVFLVVAANLGALLGWVRQPDFTPAQQAAFFGTGGMVLMLLWAPVWEELLFRGWLYQKLQGALPPWLAAFAITDLFVLAHAGTAQAMPYPAPYLGAVFVFSLAMSWLRRRHQSLLLCMAAHLFNNAVTVAAMLWVARAGS